MTRIAPRLILALMVLLLSGCTQGASTQTTAVEESENPTLIICKDFLGLVDEADTGIITDYELRERYKIIYEKAKVFNDSELISGVTKTLAAITRGNKDEYQAEALSFTDICQERLGFDVVWELLGNDPL